MLVLAVSACKDGPASPSPPSADGATIVRGTEQLEWSQAGYVSGLRFLAYVDDQPVWLGSVMCDGDIPAVTCSAPLPPMVDGVHTISLAAVLGTSLESRRSESIRIQKVSESVSNVSSLRDAGFRAVADRFATAVRVAADLAFDADVVARGIRGPAQMATSPDGRLLVAEADGSVRIVRPGDAQRPAQALDVGHSQRMFGGILTAAPGLAIDPDFARNRWVYLAATIDDGEARRLRLVRLREVADTLGDPVSVFETTVATREPASVRDRISRPSPAEGPRLAFGPDGALYIALPEGVIFVREPRASRPYPSILRIRTDSLAPDVPPLTGVRAHPAAFTWDPSTGALWLAFAGNDVLTLEPATMGVAYASSRTGGQPTIEPLQLPVARRRGPAGMSLVVGNVARLQAHELTRAVLRTRGPTSAVRLMMPVETGTLGDRIGDLVAGPDGTWYAATTNAGQDGDVVVRLSPVNRDRARPRPREP